MHYWDATFGHTYNGIVWSKHFLLLAISERRHFFLSFALLLDVKTLQRMAFMFLGSAKSFPLQVGLYEGRFHKGEKLCSHWPFLHRL